MADVNFIGKFFNLSDDGGDGRAAAFIAAGSTAELAYGSPAQNYPYVVATPSWQVNENLFQLVILSHTDTKPQYGHAIGTIVTEIDYEISCDNGTALLNAMNANYAAATVPGVSSTVTVALGTAANYALLGYSAVTNSDGANTSISGGNIGDYPSGTITPGTPAWTLTGGATVVVATSQNQTDLANAIIFFAGLPSTALSASYATQTFTATSTGYNGGPGFVGNATSTLLFSGGIITLDGANLSNPVFVFQVVSALNVTTASTTISLINGATADNVVWVVGSTATFDAHNHVWAGNILAHTSITLDSLNTTPFTTFNGRALANTGAVTISDAVVMTVPSGGTPGSVSYVQDVEATRIEYQPRCQIIQSN